LICIYISAKNNLADIRRFAALLHTVAIGLVLGGGGARVSFHVGVVKRAVRTGLESDFIGGTSVGAYSTFLL
jgi:predicted acylesterase/phospholipase RssA